MKQIKKQLMFLFFAGLMLRIPLQAQQNDDWKSAKDSWQQVRELTKELDALIEKRQLSQVHDAALNLRDSVRDMRLTWQNLDAPKREAINNTIRRVDGLTEELHEQADHNQMREVVENQRGLHVALDELAAQFPTSIVQPIGPLTANESVKDPFCRMTVDPATAAAKVVAGGQTYYFCSANEAEQFKKNPAPYVALYDDLQFGQPKVFSVGLAGRNVQARIPTTIVLAIREQGQNSLVQKYQMVHEKLMHLIVVRDDLSWFSHEHPQLFKDGRFYLKMTFPQPGRYFLYSDFTPVNAVNQVLRSEINVRGKHSVKYQPPVLTPDKELSKSLGNYKISLQVRPTLQAGKQSLLTYSLSNTGVPVTDLQSYLGATGHLMAIHQNGRDVVHTHAVSAGEDPHTGLEVTPQMATSAGPNVSFKLQLPAAGLYRIWAQFQHQGKVLTVPFTFRVSGNPNGSPGENMNHSMKTMTVLAAGVALGAAHAAPHAAPGKTTPKKSAMTPQKITITLPEDYKDNSVAVKAGKPVALTFFLKGDAGCGNTIKVPAAKWEKDLKVGQKATVIYTPAKSGKLAFACGMDMMKGSIIVK